MVPSREGRERKKVGEFHTNRHCKTTTDSTQNVLSSHEIPRVRITIPWEIKLLLLNKHEEQWESLPKLIPLLSEFPIHKGLMKDVSKL